MSALIIRSAVKADAVGEVDAAIEQLFAAIKESQPSGVRYASCKLSDGVIYLALLELDEGIDNPCPLSPSSGIFRTNSKPGRLAHPPPNGQR